MSFTLRRGLANVYCAEIISDTEEAFETGTPFKLIAASEMTRTVGTDKTDVYFDNDIFATVGKENPTEININGSSLRPADRAKILGKFVDETTGAILDTGEFVEKYFAVGAETENIDGTKEYFWFMKGTFSAPDENDKTKDDTTDTNGSDIAYKAIRTKHKFTVGDEKKGVKRVVIDTETAKLKDEQDWFAQVVTPENIASFVEKVTA